MRLIWIRHGTTGSNTLQKYTGLTDEPLSEEGFSTLQIYSKGGRYPAADLVVTSPMCRCTRTAELLYGREPDLMIGDWKEIDFGNFEGKNYQELKDDPDYQAWIDSNGNLPFPGGEGKAAFTKRCMRGFEQFLSKVRKIKPEPGTAACIVHGGTIMAILSAYTAEDYFSFQCKNGEGFLCEIDLSGQIRFENLRRL